jgi:hypothetical protein
MPLGLLIFLGVLTYLECEERLSSLKPEASMASAESLNREGHLHTGGGMMGGY